MVLDKLILSSTVKDIKLLGVSIYGLTKQVKLLEGTVRNMVYQSFYDNEDKSLIAILVLFFITKLKSHTG